MNRKGDTPAEAASRKAVALAANAGGWNPLNALAKAYLKVDHEIDYGGRTKLKQKKFEIHAATRQDLLKAKLRDTVRVLQSHMFYASHITLKS